MKGYLYILKCADNSYYVGSTTNLEVRLAGHQSGDAGSGFTVRRLPVSLVFSEEFPSMQEAFLAEREVKGWSRIKKEALIRRDYAALPELSWSTARSQELVLRQAQDDSRAVLLPDDSFTGERNDRHAELVEARERNKELLQDEHG
jgi:putative endonuclease